MLDGRIGPNLVCGEVGRFTPGACYQGIGVLAVGHPPEGPKTFGKMRGETYRQARSLAPKSCSNFRTILPCTLAASWSVRVRSAAWKVSV